jgi:transcription elongation factor S-II
VAVLTISQESKAGLAVGKLRQHASKDVADLAKDLVKKWKSEIDRAKGPNASKGTNGKAPRTSGLTLITPTTL